MKATAEIEDRGGLVGAQCASLGSDERGTSKAGYFCDDGGEISSRMAPFVKYLAGGFSDRG